MNKYASNLIEKMTVSCCHFMGWKGESWKSENFYGFEEIRFKIAPVCIFAEIN